MWSAARTLASTIISASRSRNPKRCSNSDATASTPVPEERRIHVSTYNVGDKVLHKVFGEGTVQRVDGKTVCAEYPGYGEKTVVESFLSRPK